MSRTLVDPPPPVLPPSGAELEPFQTRPSVSPPALAPFDVRCYLQGRMITRGSSTSGLVSGFTILVVKP